ncbi:Protein piccolo [Actinoplanes sp. SE50]|uniref:protein piccolo n=1 Tax=unclassified Actinoplanes TaxID=2626549 RepID=UPI00023ED0F1|nr:MULTISPECIES: protein piccolo [unclassified Actinoplanes]AEV86638.1 Protein piccolo [Actinoplanes sp. SE50/110]ATO85036.1 Protein piccolo [Actinoplanes sp. SE50]SLM02446.1 protein piccolo [Actinoplanes sp. SE50/110]
MTQPDKPSEKVPEQPDTDKPEIERPETVEPTPEAAQPEATATPEAPEDKREAEPESEPEHEEAAEPADEPTAAEPTAAEPTAAEPADEPTAAEPTAAEPTDERAAAEPTTALPEPPADPATAAAMAAAPTPQQPGWPAPQQGGPGWPAPQQGGWQPPAPPQPGWPQQPVPLQGWPQQPVPPQGWPQQPVPPQAGWPQQPVPQPGGWQPPAVLLGPPAPPREPAKTDRLAAALGNASFLSLGYFLMRRTVLGVLTLLASLILLLGIVPAVHTGWIEIVAVLWWIAMIVHGWFLARGPVEPATRTRQRIVGIAAAAVVLLLLGGLRVQAATIGSAVDDAKAAGDCGGAVSKLDKLWFGLRVADGPMAAEGDDTVEACRQLNEADETLTGMLTAPSATGLTAGFDQINTVLTRFPGHEKMADAVLDGFLGKLPLSDACGTATITSWLAKRPKTNNTLDRSAEVVAKHEPAALAGCGDTYLNGQQWESAKVVYQQLIDTYPTDVNKPKAEEGIAKADLAIEFDAFKDATDSVSGNYCDTPVKYSAAKAYGKGVNRAMVFGNDTEAKRLPGGWKTTDPTVANLVLCVSGDSQGAAVRSCDYGSAGQHRVTFHKVKVTVRGYEVRSGKQIFSKTLQFSGTSCPHRIEYMTTLGVDLGPPRHMDVKVDANDVQAQFKPLIVK